MLWFFSCRTISRNSFRSSSSIFSDIFIFSSRIFALFSRFCALFSHAIVHDGRSEMQRCNDILIKGKVEREKERDRSNTRVVRACLCRVWPSSARRKPRAAWEEHGQQGGLSGPRSAARGRCGTCKTEVRSTKFFGTKFYGTKQ